jgi:hypothetical protein
MFDIGTLTTAAAIAIGVLTWVGLTRVLGNADPGELASMFGKPWELDWPRGVQEEEPFRWRLGEPARVATVVPRALPALVATEACDECAEDPAAA